MKQADGGIASLILGCCFGTLIANTLLSEKAMKKVIFAVKWGMNNPLVIIYYILPFLLLVLLIKYYKYLHKGNF